MGDKSYENWKKRLAGEKVPTHDGDPDAGFYRKPIRSSRQEGNHIIGWEPVAYFYATHEGRMVGVIGSRDMTDNEVTDLWTYCCAYPIPELVYRNVAEDGQPWPEGLIGEPKRKPAATNGNGVPAADRAVTTTDNAPPVDDRPLDQQHKDAIDAAIAAPVTPVTSDDEDALAQGRKNRIAELRLAADKAGKAIYEPIYRAYSAEQKKWAPLVKACTDVENRLQREILTYRDAKRRKAEEAQRKLEAEAMAREEANRRAADRAIARGEPEPAPAVAPAPDPVAAVKPAPVAPTYGSRTVKEKLKKFAEIVDWDAVLRHYRDHDDMTALLLKLAQADVDAGRTVPGVTIREGLI